MELNNIPVEDGGVDLTAGDPNFQDLTKEELELFEKISKKIYDPEKRKELNLIAESKELLGRMFDFERKPAGKIWKDHNGYWIKFRDGQANPIPTNVIGLLISEIVASSSGDYFKDFSVSW